MASLQDSFIICSNSLLLQHFNQSRLFSLISTKGFLPSPYISIRCFCHSPKQPAQTIRCCGVGQMSKMENQTRRWDELTCTVSEGRRGAWPRRKCREERWALSKYFVERNIPSALLGEEAITATVVTQGSSLKGLSGYRAGLSTTDSGRWELRIPSAWDWIDWDKVSGELLLHFFKCQNLVI